MSGTGSAGTWWSMKLRKLGAIGGELKDYGNGVWWGAEGESVARHNLRRTGYKAIGHC